LRKQGRDERDSLETNISSNSMNLSIQLTVKYFFASSKVQVPKFIEQLSQIKFGTIKKKHS
jgi:hypothetical protein